MAEENFVRSGSRAHVRWAGFNLALAVLAGLVTAWILVEEQRVREAITELQKRRAQDCASKPPPAAPSPVVEAEAKPPPQDKAIDGYIGPTGVDITPVMLHKLEAVRDRDPPQQQADLLRLGSQDALPSGAIHVINLWATWCGPCRDEMPDFKTLFARRADWGETVRFLPIMLKDHTDPIRAYGTMGSSMPTAPVKLADRRYQDPLATVLAADDQQRLFRDNLPVTLVLDCNRRVRWAQFSQLSRMDLKELERHVDLLREELADTSPGAWCTRPWPGNGRCEGLEDTPEHHSLADCGELKRRPEEAPVPSPDAEAPLLPQPPVECPAGTSLNPQGICKRDKLKGTTPKAAPAAANNSGSCGNGTCDAGIGETPATCCQDCPCLAPLICRAASDGTHMCLVPKLKL